MKPTPRIPLVLPLLILLVLALLVLAAGCSDRDPAGLPAAVGNEDPLVFDDAYGENIYFQAFFQTHITATSFDSVFAYGGLAQYGARSLKINVPPQGSSLGLYTGGVLTSAVGRDLQNYNALTFYARANQPITLDVAGFGNDNTGTSRFEAGRGNVPIGTEWSFIVVPIPDASKLRSERGMFTFAEAVEAGLPGGYDFWVDEIRWADLGNVEVFRASMTPANKMNFLGATADIAGTRTIFLVDGGYVPVDHSPGYFDFVSSDPSVARIEDNLIRIVGLGSAAVTARLDTLDVFGTINVTGFAPPTTAAAVPTLPATDVISLFSDAYVDMPVTTWRADWGGSTTQYEEYAIGASRNKLYSSLNFVGIDFAELTIDASSMTHLHLDVYAPAGTNFKVKLVSFAGPTGAQTSDLILDATTTPAFTSGGWSSLDIPLADFTLPATGWSWGAVGQLVLSTNDAQLVLVDNIYFHK